MERHFDKNAVIRALRARLAMDADLGAEYVARDERIFASLDAMTASSRPISRARATPPAALPSAPLSAPPSASFSAPPSALEKPAGAGTNPIREFRPRLEPPPPQPPDPPPERRQTAAGHFSVVPFVPPPASPEKEAALADLRRQSESCRECGLCERRTTVVWGEGSLDAEVMFIGEGPGRDEDREGRPFVGRSGMLLTDIIEKGMKTPRSGVYIANVVKCRPPGNRDPKPEEVAACSLYLRRQIEVIRPKVIVAVGMVAGRALLGLPPGTGGLRRTWHEYGGIPMRVIYHPSYLLRQRQSDNHRTEADVETWKDIQDVMQRLTTG